MYKIYMTLTLISALVLGHVPIVNAQQFQRAGDNQYSQRVRQTDAAPAAEFKRVETVALERNINLPDVPTFPGAKFVSGQQAKPNSQITIACTIDYAIAKSSSSQVVSFYSNAFSTGGWKIDQQNDYSVNAINDKSNSHCNVSVDADEGSEARLHINYSRTPKVTYSGEE